MLVIPAIDILGGKCVRLSRGDFSERTVYHDEPAEMAALFARQGAEMIHVVDLDGAKQGAPVNMDKVLEIAARGDAAIQASGGVRTHADAKRYLDGGVRRITLGTVAVEEPGLLERLLREYGPERVAVSVDIKEGRVATRGWLEQGAHTAAEVIPMLKRMGVSTTVVTDVSRDGLLGGANLELTRMFVDAGFSAIAAGGVASMADVGALQSAGAHGAILGKAVYEGVVDLPAAIALASRRSGLAKRIVPCLDVKDGRVVKGTHFKELRDAGDPVELGRRYSEMGADELVFLDISATLERRKTLAELVSGIARELSIPFTVGGGISSVKDIEMLLRAGADKISIGSAAVLDAEMVREASDYFGSQCVVISVDAKRRVGGAGGWEVYIKGGTEATGVDALEFSARMEQMGAGELLVNSLDRDGTREGFDVELLRGIAGRVNMPVIASSGAGSAEHFLEVFRDAGVDAALGATVFHYGEIELGDLKRYLARSGLQIRI